MTERDDMTRDDRPAGSGRPFDDDRLLAFVLELEDDPELRAAAERDPALRARLEAMRADADAVGAGLDRVVPPPPDDYTDLSDPRWGGLRDFVAAPAPAAPRRRGLWVRVLAPAAAIALVLLVGVVGVQYLGGSGGGKADLSTSATDDKGAEGVGDENGSLQSGATSGAAEGADGAAPTLGEGAPDASAYATVLVARARTPGDVRQRFDVVRVLRGDAQAYGEGTVVALDVLDRAVAPGRLVVLYLAPAPPPAPAATASGRTTPAPRQRDLGSAVFAYRYHGAEALALQLAPDADVGALTLP